MSPLAGAALFAVLFVALVVAFLLVLTYNFDAEPAADGRPSVELRPLAGPGQDDAGPAAADPNGDDTAR